MQLLMRVNKDALLANYMKSEPQTIMPAKAGIQGMQLKKNDHWMSAFAGMTRY